MFGEVSVGRLELMLLGLAFVILGATAFKLQWQQSKRPRLRFRRKGIQPIDQEDDPPGFG